MEDGGPSVTARRVAAHRLGFSRVPAPYGAPAADETLAADVAAGLVAPANRINDYLAARTSFFDRTVVGAIDRGVRQVVVGAAGYDGRAFRYAKPGVRWFEVDHPATQRDKLERLQRLGIATSHVPFVEADFTRDPVADRLRSAGIQAAVPSLFLLEGVAVYLDPAVLETVLEQFRRAAAPGSRLAISVSLSREYDEGARARFQAAVAALGEPARSTFDADQAEDLLARTGWRIMPGRADTAAKRERLRSAGLLTASAGPRAPRASAPSRPSKQPMPSTSPALSAPQPGTPSLSALLSQALSPSTAPPGRSTRAVRDRTPSCAPPPRGCGPARCGCRCPASSSSAGGNASAPARLTGSGIRSPRQDRPPHSTGPAGPASLPRVRRHDRAALARALHRRCD